MNWGKSVRILFILWLPCLIVGACHKKPPTVTVRPPPKPPLPSSLEIANESFDSGLYDEAARSYEAYLNEDAAAADHDQALFKLGLSYALAGKIPEDFNRAQIQLRTLVTQFPRSRYRPEAEYILSLQTDIEKLRLGLRENEEGIRSRDTMIHERDERIKERDEKIRRLTQELERMKKIDLERRPSRPPE